MDQRLLLLRAQAQLTPADSGPYEFTLVQVGGVARVRVGGDVVLDGTVDPPGPGERYFGMGSRELTATVQLEAGTPVEVAVEYASRVEPSGPSQAVIRGRLW